MGTEHQCWWREGWRGPSPAPKAEPTGLGIVWFSNAEPFHGKACPVFNFTCHQIQTVRCAVNDFTSFYPPALVDPVKKKKGHGVWEKQVTIWIHLAMRILDYVPRCLLWHHHHFQAFANKVFLFMWHAISHEPRWPFCLKASWVVFIFESTALYLQGSATLSRIRVHSEFSGVCYCLNRPWIAFRGRLCQLPSRVRGSFSWWTEAGKNSHNQIVKMKCLADITNPND
jgi:hypothetical protein